jgi:hypothetical protein
VTFGKILYLPVAFLVCCLAMGIPYWQTPYEKLSLPDSLYAPGLLLAFICAIVFCVFNTRLVWSAAVFGCCAPVVVATRIILDVCRDATSHNLFPFELAIAVMLGFLISGIGAMLGTGVRKLFFRDTVKK